MNEENDASLSPTPVDQTIAPGPTPSPPEPVPIPYHPPIFEKHRRKDRRTILLLGAVCGILALLLAAAVLGPYISSMVNGAVDGTDTTSASSLALEYPADASTIDSASTTFIWERIAGASSYYFTVYADDDPSDSLTTTVMRNQCTVEGLNDATSYYWKVCPIFFNQLGEWSDTWTFEVDIATSAPDMTSVSNNTYYAESPELSWGSVTSATSYRLEVSNSSTFDLLLLDTEISNCSYVLDIVLEENATYYWRVAAYADGEWSEWSDYRCFKVLASTIYFTHTWTFYMDQTTWTVGLNISAEDYVAAHSQDRVSGLTLSDYNEYITPDDATVVELASVLHDMAESMGYDTYTTACFVLSFVQTMTYTSDLESAGLDEYPKYPIEMLVDGCGDCEDSSALFCSLITSAVFGMDATLVYLENAASAVAHMAVGLVIEDGSVPSRLSYGYDGENYTVTQDEMAGWSVFSSFHQSKFYYYCECTSEYPIGWPTSVSSWRYALV